MSQEKPMDQNNGTLQSCLSDAWGGLEMVAFETAVKLKAHGHLVTTICPPGSPLQNKLVEAGLPTIGVSRSNRYFAPKAVRTYRNALRSGRYSSVLVQQLNDLLADRSCALADARTSSWSEFLTASSGFRSAICCTAGFIAVSIIWWR